MPLFDCRVMEARDLPHKTTVKPCPFVVLEICGARAATPPAYYSSSPTFDSVFKFNAQSIVEPMKVTVWNEGSCCGNDEQWLILKIDLTGIGLIQGEVKDDWYHFPNSNSAVRLRIVAHNFGLLPQLQMPPQHHQYQQHQQMMPHYQQQPQQQHQYQQQQILYQEHHQQYYGSVPPPPPLPQEHFHDVNTHPAHLHPRFEQNSGYFYQAPPVHTEHFGNMKQ